MADKGHHKSVRSDYIDYPTGWEMQRQIGTGSPPHHPECSAHVADGAFLCDCDAISDHWHKNYAGGGDDE